MTMFRYRALDASGQRIDGEIAAESEAEVIALLQSKDLLPIEARPFGQAAARSSNRPRLRQQARITVALRELATLIDAAQPVDQALMIVIESMDRQALQRVFKDLLDIVRGGGALSDALETEQRYFAPIDVSLVRAGEAAGGLGTALDELATMREKRAQLARKINSALIYPAILALTAIGAIILLLTVVIPEFRLLFNGREDQIPADARLIFAISGTLGEIGVVEIAITLALILALGQLRHVPAVRQAAGRLVQALPLIGRYVRVRNSAQLSRALAALRAGGVDLPHALDLGRSGLSSQTAQRAIGEVIRRVREGVPLADALGRTQILDPIAIRLIRAGEQSGRLDPMLGKVARIFEDKLESGLMRMVAVLEPLLVLVMGVLAGGIVLSVMSAVLSVNALTG